MAKTKTPFFSFGAQGSVAGSITAQKLRGETLLRGIPFPTDPYSLPQAYQRWLYQDFASLWAEQSVATRQEYAAAGVRFHLTGFQYWMRVMLTTLPNILGIWHLDEKVGALAYDSSRNLTHATIFGASPADGAINGAFYFDGLNNWLKVSDSFHTLEELTIEFLFSTTHNAYQVAFGIGSAWGSGTIDWVCQIKNTGICTFNVYRYSYSVSASSPIAYNDGDFHHFLATLTAAKKLTLYIDGQFNASNIHTAAYKDKYDRCQSGVAPGRVSQWFKGTLDNIILYNRVLSTQDIQKHSQRRYPL